MPPPVAAREGAAQVSGVQRARVLAAMVHVVAEHGVGGATVARVVARAGVSRRTFYEQFSGCEECFLAVFEDTLARASRVVSEAVSGVRPVWREQLRAGLQELLAFFDAEPLSGSLLIVDALGGGPYVLERRTRTLEQLTAIVDQGRSETKQGRGTALSSPPSLTAEGVVGAVLSVIHARMLEHRAHPPVNGSSSRSGSRRVPAPLSDLLNPLMGLIVLPYQGQAAAQNELARPTPKASHARRSSTPSTTTRPPRDSSHDPLQGLNMRLTYRTLVVLAAIATDPGASNRQIADHAGIHDQGQISKLLTRLQRLGLIHNAAAGHSQTHGEPNAWTLTPRGTEIQHALTTTTP